jgi:membrane-bound inhibitor of C-type lysozyme
MATLLKHTLAACVAALAAASLCTASASAATTETHPKATKVLKHKAKKPKKAEAETGAASKDDPEPDITDTVTTEFHCELGNKVTIYTNEKDADHIALRWKNRLHRMSRVSTTTGAQRYENPAFGIIWIGIPAKSILLDSKQNRQLANECKNAEQTRPAVAAVTPEAPNTDAARIGS